MVAQSWREVFTVDGINSFAINHPFTKQYQEWTVCGSPMVRWIHLMNNSNGYTLSKISHRGKGLSSCQGRVDGGAAMLTTDTGSDVFPLYCWDSWAAVQCWETWEKLGMVSFLDFILCNLKVESISDWGQSFAGSAETRMQDNPSDPWRSV